MLAPTGAALQIDNCQNDNKRHILGISSTWVAISQDGYISIWVIIIIIKEQYFYFCLLDPPLPIVV